MITEPGQSAQMIAEEEHKPELKLVQTQLQLMVVQIVLGRRLKVRVATYRSAQVHGRMKQKNIFPLGLNLRKSAKINYQR